MSHWFEWWKRICTVSTYIKEFLSIVEIENKKCQRCSKFKPLAEIISEKLIIILEGLPTSNSIRQIDHPKCTTLTKGTVFLDVMIQNYFKDSLLDDVICGNCSSGGSESIKSRFTVSIYLKKPPSVLKILFHWGSYDRTTLVATKNELKVAIPSEYFLKQPSNNYKISYTLVSLINHDGDSLDCGHYVSYFFYSSTGIWWHCDDENITEISDLPKGVYYRETHKPTNKKKINARINICIFCCIYQNKPTEKTQLYIFNNSEPCPKVFSWRK